MNCWKTVLNDKIQKYNQSIRQQVYLYDEMQTSLAKSMHYLTNGRIDSVLEIGAGTGNLTRAVLENNQITKIYIVDINKEMLTICKDSLSEIVKNQGCQIEYTCQDIYEFPFKTICLQDFIISSFTLHHASAQDNLELYKSIFFVLKAGGTFLNLDLIKSNNPQINSILTAQFHDFLVKNMGRDQAEETIRQCGEIDNPLDEHEILMQLDSAGFRSYGTLFKVFNFTLFAAIK